MFNKNFVVIPSVSANYCRETNLQNLMAENNNNWLLFLTVIWVVWLCEAIPLLYVGSSGFNVTAAFQWSSVGVETERWPLLFHGLSQGDLSCRRAWISPNAVEVPGEQMPKLPGLLKARPRTGTMSSPCSRGGEISSSSWWEERHMHVRRGGIVQRVCDTKTQSMLWKRREIKRSRN